jgi:hypothetical protein
MKISHAILLMFLTSITAYAPFTNVSPQEYDRYLNDPDVPRVQFEVCLPSSKVYFDDFVVESGDQPSRLLQWRTPTSAAETPRPFIKVTTASNTGGVRSLDSAPLYLMGATVKGQPVFLNDGNERPGDLLGIGVVLPVADGGGTRTTTYWYRVPKNSLTKASTFWQQPFAKELSDNNSAAKAVDLRLMNGIPVPDQVLLESSPRIRFSLKTYREQQREQTVFQAAKESGLRRYQQEHPSKKLIYLTVPPAKEIPEC